MKIQVFCHQCGISFSVSPSRINKSICCSKSCKTRFMFGNPLLRFYKNIQKPIQLTTCWRWLGGTDSHGYGRLYAYGRNIIASRFSYDTHIGEIPKNLWVLHKCNHEWCVNPSHLYVGTPKDNTRDLMQTEKYFQLTPPRGSAAPWAILTECDVIIIRSLYGKETGRNLAKRFGVSEVTISAIQKRRIWKHL